MPADSAGSTCVANKSRNARMGSSATPVPARRWSGLSQAPTQPQALRTSLWRPQDLRHGFVSMRLHVVPQTIRRRLERQAERGRAQRVQKEAGSESMLARCLRLAPSVLRRGDCSRQQITRKSRLARAVQRVPRHEGSRRQNHLDSRRKSRPCDDLRELWSTLSHDCRGTDREPAWPVAVEASRRTSGPRTRRSLH